MCWCVVTSLCSWSCCSWTAVWKRNTFVHLSHAKNASESHVSSSSLMNLYLEVIVFKRESKSGCFFSRYWLNSTNWPRAVVWKWLNSDIWRAMQFGFRNWMKYFKHHHRTKSSTAKPNWMWHPMCVEHLVHPFYDHAVAAPPQIYHSTAMCKISNEYSSWCICIAKENEETIERFTDFLEIQNRSAYHTIARRMGHSSEASCQFSDCRLENRTGNNCQQHKVAMPHHTYILSEMYTNFRSEIVCTDPTMNTSCC